MKGWSRKLFRFCGPQPATDHWLLTKAPITQWPGMVSATTDGPTWYLPVPSMVSVAVGSVMVGPTPQISLVEPAGESKNVGLMSPRPEALRIPGAVDG